MALICAIIANAANIPGGTKLYLTPNSNWKVDGARFAAYFFGNGESWVSMTAVSGETDLYEVTAPTGSWTNVIFCRMNPSATANNWNNKWNQTSDLIYDGVNNHYTVAAGAWDKGAGSWSFYGVAENVELGLSWSPEKIYPGDMVTITASVIGNPEGSIIKIDVNGEVTEGTTATWTAGEAGTYSVKATCESNTGDELASTEGTITVQAVTSQFTVYLEKKSTSWTNVNVYSWDSSGATQSGAWPGLAMEVKDVDGDDYYYYTFKNISSVNVIFNNASEQTVDITNVTKDTYFVLGTKDGGGKYAILKYDVPTGVEDAMVDDVTAEYYNLQGVKVANPENGIFIKKQGAKTTKIIL